MANSPAKPFPNFQANQNYMNDTPAFICLSLLLIISFFSISIFSFIHYSYVSTIAIVTFVLGLCQFIWRFERTPFSHGEFSLTLNHDSHFHEEL
jgi:hypothetical protein